MFCIFSRLNVVGGIWTNPVIPNRRVSSQYVISSSLCIILNAMLADVMSTEHYPPLSLYPFDSEAAQPLRETRVQATAAKLRTRESR